MTEYHSVNVKLSDFQLDNLKPAAKNTRSITLKSSSDMISTDENNLHILIDC